MATKKQRQAAKKNVRKAQRAARQKRTIAHMSKAKRTALGKQAANVAHRKGKNPNDYSNWTKQELMERAREIDLQDRSKLGRDALIRALRKAA